MKNKKMLSPGMTLVEVMVSVVIFAIMVSAILTAIKSANDISNRSKMRDVELAEQAVIAGKRSQSQLTDLTPSADINNETTKGYYIEYAPSGIGETVNYNGVHLYETDEGTFSENFDFKIKTIANPNDLTGVAVQKDQLQDKECLIEFTNELPEDVMIYITTTEGMIFEGSRGSNGYIHTNNTYSRRIPAGGSINFGYYNTQAATIEYRIVKETTSASGYIETTKNLTVDPLDSEKDNRSYYRYITQDGTDPVLIIQDTP